MTVNFSYQNLGIEQDTPPNADVQVDGQSQEGYFDSIEPKTLTATGTLTQGQITIEVVSGTLAPSYESEEKGDALLNLRDGL